MNGALIAFLLAAAVSLLSVIGDVFVKNASLQSAFNGWKPLIVGMIIYALTGLGWFFVMRKEKLSTLGVTFSVSTIIFVTLLSVFYFKEKINVIEIGAIITAIISLIVLYRFA